MTPRRASVNGVLGVFGSVCGVILVAGAIAQTVPKANVPLYDPASSSVLVSDKGGHGSGVIIRKGLILTAAHVVKGLDEAEVKTANGEPRKARVVWRGVGNDVALLAGDTEGGAPAPISCGLEEQGAQVVIHGNPLEFRNVATWGRIARKAPVDIDDLKSMVVLDATVNPGNSGGGVWNARNQLVGIVSAVALSPIETNMAMLRGAAPTPLGLMTPSAVFCELLAR